MRAPSRAALTRIRKLEAPAKKAEQVGVMIIPTCTMEEWEAAAMKQQAELMAACAEDRGEDADDQMPKLPDPMTRTNKSPSR